MITPHVEKVRQIPEVDLIGTLMDELRNITPKLTAITTTADRRTAPGQAWAGSAMPGLW